MKKTWILFALGAIFIAGSSAWGGSPELWDELEDLFDDADQFSEEVALAQQKSPSPSARAKTQPKAKQAAPVAGSSKARSSPEKSAAAQPKKKGALKGALAAQSEKKRAPAKRPPVKQIPVTDEFDEEGFLLGEALEMEAAEAPVVKPKKRAPVAAKRKAKRALQEVADASDENVQPEPQSEQQPVAENPPIPGDFQLFVGDNGVYFSGEFLYWKALEGSSTEFAFVKNFPVYNDGIQIADGLAGKVYSAHFDWKPGFRLEIGYQVPHDSFELSAQYTFYRTHGLDQALVPLIANPEQVNQASMKSVFPTNFTSGPPNSLKANSDIRLSYQLADLKLEKHFALSNYFSLGITGEVEVAWLHQQWKVNILNVMGQTSFNKSNWSYKGAGPGIGFDCNWYFLKQFSLFTDISASLLYGMHHNELTTLCSSGTVNPLFQKIAPEAHRVAPHTQISLGLSWDYRWKKKNGFFSLYAGYELNTWFNVHEVYRYHDIGLTGSQPETDVLYSVSTNLLQLQGIKVGAEVHF